MSFWQDLDARTIAGLIPRIYEALRSARRSMQQFSNLGVVSHQLAAAYPRLRDLRGIISELDRALIDGRAEITNKRREAMGVPLRSARRTRKSTPDYDAAQLRATAAGELETARRHIGNAMQALKRSGASGNLLMQLHETGQFLSLAKEAAKRRVK